MRKSVLKRMIGYTKPYKTALIIAFISAALNVLFTLLAPVLVGKAIDEIIDVGNVHFQNIIKILVILGITILLSAFFQWIMNINTRKVSAYAAQDMRQEAFERLNIVPLKYIDQSTHGDLMSRLVNDADNVSEGLLQGITQLFPGIATILGTLIVMFVLNPLIALIVVVVTPVSIFFAKFVAKHTNEMFKKQSEAQGKLSGFINEMVKGQNVVEAFGYQDKCLNDFREISDELFDSGLKAVFYSSVTNPGTRFVNGIVYAAVCVVGAITAIYGYISVGNLSAFLTYANQYTKPFNEVTGVLTQLQTAIASAQRLFDVIDEPAEKQDKQNAIAPTTCRGDVTIKDVFFSYNPKIPLIEHFNLTAKAGQKIAIVGHTGCGKTTLINLLMRFYDVNSGTIEVDGNNIYDMKRNALRNMYGMVLQETWLKNATVKENIAYGKPDATDEEIVAAAKAAYAHGFIRRLPKGYDTIISAGGDNLSAGQKQLLCIARIMLCKPQMLILDEATSSIDTRTEMLIQQAFEKLMEGHTSFVVAHRLSTIQTADTIVVMDAGHIVEQGTHHELLEKGGFYANLYNSQFAIE